MIHYGKTPQGDLEILVSADAIGEFQELFDSAGLTARREIVGLSEYVKKEFAAEIESYRHRMTAQEPANIKRRSLNS